MKVEKAGSAQQIRFVHHNRADTWEKWVRLDKDRKETKGRCSYPFAPC